MNEIDAKIYMSSDQGFFNQCDSFKGLVLRDVLEKLPENTDIRIGAATNWFYFGSSSDEEKMNFTFRKRISEAQLNYKKLVDDIKSKEKVLKNLYQQKERAEAYINNYTSPLDRKIDDAYECKGNFYFVVNGSEVGKYWTKEEFEGDAKNERS